MIVKEITKTSQKKLPAEKMEDLVKKMKKEHEKLVKGMFEFTDAQSGWLDFSYRFFKDDPLMTIRLTHGEIVELPMGIVKHLNNTYKKIRTLGGVDPSDSSGLPAGALLGGKGVPSTYLKTSRVRFTPMDMM